MEQGIKTRDQGPKKVGVELNPARVAKDPEQILAAGQEKDKAEEKAGVEVPDKDRRGVVLENYHNSYIRITLKKSVKNT